MRRHDVTNKNTMKKTKTNTRQRYLKNNVEGPSKHNITFVITNHYHYDLQTGNCMWFSNFTFTDGEVCFLKYRETEVI